MFGNNHRVNPIESRKQLLIAESEINRAQLVQEWQAMAEGIRSAADRARTVSFLTSAAAAMIAGLVSFRRHTKTARADEKSSWGQTLLKGARLAGSLWSEFRPRPQA